MKRTLTVPIVLGCAVLLSSCSSFAYLFSDDYLAAGIRVTTNPADVKDLQLVNHWSSEFTFTYNDHDVGVWAANRLAKEGRHDVLVLVELISAWNPPYRGASIGGDLIMWRISVYRLPAKDAAK